MANRKATTTAVIIGAAVVAGFFLYRAGAFKSFLKTYRVKLGSPSFNKSETASAWYTKVFINVPLLIDNPTSASGTVSAVKLDVGLNGKKVTEISKAGSADIKPNSTSTVNLLVGIPVANVPGLVKIVTQGLKGSALNLTVSGAIDTSEGLINVNETVQLK